MLQAGIPMVQCFDIIGNGHDKPSMQKLVLAIKGDVEAGTSLHEALAKHPLYFDDLFVNLVEAGEHAGALETLLDKVATYKEKTEALKKKIKKALFYPAAVLAVAIIVTIILLIFVIPQFESLFKGFGADLPAFTQMVINLSRFVQAKGWWMADRRRRRAATRSSTSRSARGRCGSALDRMMLKAPVIGPIMVKAAIARYSRTLSTMFARRRAAGRSADLGGRRDRQHRLRGSRHCASATKSRPASACSAAMENDRPVPEHGDPDDRRRRGVRLARPMAAKVADFYEADVDAAVDAHEQLARAADHGDPRRAGRRPRHRHVPADLQAGRSRLTRASLDAIAAHRAASSSTAASACGSPRLDLRSSACWSAASSTSSSIALPVMLEREWRAQAEEILREQQELSG